MTYEQIENEKRKEAEYNRLFETVIKYSPFASWYPLMIGASRVLTDSLPKSVGIDLRDGRPVIVYKGDISKLAGTWGAPFHETWAKQISQGKWEELLVGILSGGVGTNVQGILEQKSPSVKVFNISPNEIKELYNQLENKNAKFSRANLKEAPTYTQKEDTQKIYSKTYTAGFFDTNTIFNIFMGSVIFSVILGLMFSNKTK